MEILCNLEELKKALRIALITIPSQGARLPERCLRLETVPEGLLLHTAGPLASARLLLRNVVPWKEGVCCCETRELEKALNGRQDRGVHLAVKEGEYGDEVHLLLSQEVCRKLTAWNPEAVKVAGLPERLQPVLELTEGEWRRLLRHTVFATDQDPYHPHQALSRLALEISPEQLLVIGTDGKRLSRLCLKLGTGSQEKLLLPGMVLRKLRDLFPVRGSGMVELCGDSQYLSLTWNEGRYGLIFPRTPWTYPDWRAVIPPQKNLVARCRLERRKALAALQAMEIPAWRPRRPDDPRPEPVREVRLRQREEGLELAAFMGEEKGLLKRIVSGPFDGKMETRWLDARLLLEALEAVEEDLLELGLQEDPRHALVLRPAERGGTDWLQLLMPRNPSGRAALAAQQEECAA